ARAFDRQGFHGRLRRLLKLGEQTHDIRIKRHDELSDKRWSSLPDCYEPSLFKSLISTDKKAGGPGTYAKKPKIAGKNGRTRADWPLGDVAMTAACALNLLRCIATNALLLRPVGAS
ncbi:hypothetical protein, partial [Xanthomonas perforans]|uniref:hypothetical protein n=2 Tax=Xanthomonas perforans TaxID=442694 RepID=UPI0013E8D5F5